MTINAGVESLVQINTVGCCWTNQRYMRSTPSHTVISVADLEVKFNFPLQQQPTLCTPHQEAVSEFRSHFLPPAQARQDIMTYERDI